MPLQVRMITKDSLASERERSEKQDAMLPSDLAKPIGVVNGTSVGGTRKSRTSAPASHCVSYKLDENGNKVNARVFNPSSRKPNRRKLSEEDRVEIADKLARGHKLNVTEIGVTLNIGRDYS